MLSRYRSHDENLFPTTASTNHQHLDTRYNAHVIYKVGCDFILSPVSLDADKTCAGSCNCQSTGDTLEHCKGKSLCTFKLHPIETNAGKWCTRKHLLVLAADKPLFRSKFYYPRQNLINRGRLFTQQKYVDENQIEGGAIFRPLIS